MADPIVDELNSSTVKELQNEVVFDNFFRSCAGGAYLRANCNFPFDGGAFDAFAFTYAPMIGSWYGRGTSAFNTTKPQTLSNGQFDIRTLEVNITELLEDLYINNRGRNARISLIDTDSQTAVNTLNAIFEVSLFHHGQNMSGDNRSLAMNALSEAINNGMDPSWDGNVFTNYAGQSRTGVLQSPNALNGNVYWAGPNGGAAGTGVAGATGMISYDILEDQYNRCLRTGDRQGLGFPDLILSNIPAWGFMKKRIQAAQQFHQELDPVWGVHTFRFENAIVLPDPYCPSLIAGVNDPVLGNYLTSNLTMSNYTNLTTTSNFPQNSGTSTGGGTGVGTCTPGEVIFILNTKTIMFRPVSDGPFAGEFKPFIMSAENTKVSGQFLLGCTVECGSPWNNCQIMGIGA